MSKLRLNICLLVLTAGCSGRPADDEPVGPGRFSVSAIRKTTAPWDGHAIQLLLCEKPLNAGEPTTPFVSVCIYQSESELSGKHVHLGAKESGQGSNQWVPAPETGSSLPSVDVTFETIRDGAPVTGTYDVTMPDGTRERGRFQAAWLSSHRRGG